MADQARNLEDREPPRWMQGMLFPLLAERDRQTVAGDLLEEYREEKLKRLGRHAADLWYLRQVISIARVRLTGGPMLKQILMATCLFTLAAAIWLGTMEQILKHPGYGMRTALAACIAIQSLLTLVALMVRPQAALTAMAIMGALGLAYVGFSAVVNDLQNKHFEGFVLMFGGALLIQAVLTFAVLLIKGQRGPVLRSS